jgi:hypothetical protein
MLCLSQIWPMSIKDCIRQAPLQPLRDLGSHMKIPLLAGPPWDIRRVLAIPDGETLQTCEKVAPLQRLRDLHPHMEFQLLAAPPWDIGRVLAIPDGETLRTFRVAHVLEKTLTRIGDMVKQPPEKPLAFHQN